MIRIKPKGKEEEEKTEERGRKEKVAKVKLERVISSESKQNKRSSPIADLHHEPNHELSNPEHPGRKAEPKPDQK